MSNRPEHPDYEAEVNGDKSDTYDPVVSIEIVTKYGRYSFTPREIQSLTVRPMESDK